MENLLSIIVPVYKEEKNIPIFLERIEGILNGISMEYEIIFCLDPSSDRSYEIIRENIERNNAIKLIQFSRRFGQPAATMAGIFNCKGEICIIMDVDLQDPPELIPVMIAKWREGYNVVYAKRRSRKGESPIKKMVAYLGYYLINKMSEIEIPRNTGDFRLIDRIIMENLRNLKETNAFLKGLVPLIGYKQTSVEFDREARYAGKGNYNRFIGDLRICFNGIYCFSSKPLQMMSFVGFFVVALSILLIIWYLLQKLIINTDITPGLSSTIIIVTFFSGLQLFFMGLIGEYVSRIYDEVKGRPMYIISEIIDKTQKDKE
ncbi:glycosyl transferase [Spirochaetia bacterium]|nr:glycosyl transferase [Spirochaetia bacterium]